ncbi:MAG: hypothetical protein K2G13_08590, partial [Muribaculaceae bacterium]|nr:hypothetical protein [Muribaculaceae bacterium]
IVSLALQYYNRNKSPLDILNEAKANNNGQSLYIYKNGFRTEDLEKVIGTNFIYKKCDNVKNAINNKRPLFSVYHPTGSSNYVSAVLIVGYYGENLIIYDPESDSMKSLNPGIFDMDDTFELISVL